jgi:alpha-galactosidase
MDIAWLTPGVFNDWPKEIAFTKAWNPDSVKWPNGLTFGAMAHDHGLKASLYMLGTYQDVDLATVAGRDAEKQALLERYDKGWYDYWRTDGDLEGQYNYLQHEGFLGVVDFMIAKRPGFRWELCSGGGLKKSFDMAERMTFMTTEDFARAITFRQAFYGNSYVLNPVQLKADIALDWGDAHTVAWDKYNFRSGLLGAIMVCGSTRVLNAQEEEVARETWNLYQTRQRAILRGGNVYHILPFPDELDWDGTQFYNPSLGRGSVLLFKASDKAADSKVIKLKGLDRRTKYTLNFQDRTNNNCRLTGAELMDKGMHVGGMSGAYASEIVWLSNGKNSMK